MSFNVPTMNGNLPQQSGPPSAYLGAQAAPVGQLLGEGLADVGHGLYAVEQKAKAEGDAVAARNAITQLRQYAVSDAYGEEGYAGLSGPALFSAAQTRPTAFRERHDELRQNLTPDQQVLFDDQADSVVHQYSVDMGRALTTGTARYRAESYAGEQSSIRDGRGASVANGALSLRPSITATTMGPGRQPTDLVDPMVSSDLAALDASADARVRDNPGDFDVEAAEARRILREESHTAYHAATLQALLASGQTEVASAYLSTWKDDIHGKTRDVLTEDVGRAGHAASVAREAGDIFARYADGRGTWSEKLDAMVAAAGGSATAPERRADGTIKGTGYLGVLRRPDGGVSSELSIGVEIDGKETAIPTLVPGLTAEEKSYLLGTDRRDISTADPALFAAIEEKAVAHAKARIALGKSPFANDGSAPTGVPADIRSDVISALRSQVEIAREDQRKAQADMVSGAKDAVDGGQSIHDVVGRMWAAHASDEDVGKVVEYDRARAAGKFWATDMDLYNTLSLQMVHDPQVFLRQNVDDYVLERRMNEQDAAYWKEQQGKLLTAQGKGDAALADDFLTVAGVVEQRANELWPSDAAKQGAFKYEVNQLRKTSAAASGKPLGVVETQALMDTITAKVAFDPDAAFFTNNERVVDEIPAESLAAIIDSLTRRGADVTPENIRDLWLASHADD